MEHQDLPSAPICDVKNRFNLPWPYNKRLVPVHLVELGRKNLQRCNDAKIDFENHKKVRSTFTNAPLLEPLPEVSWNNQGCNKDFVFFNLFFLFISYCLLGQVTFR